MFELHPEIDPRDLSYYGLAANSSPGAVDKLFEKGDLVERYERIVARVDECRRFERRRKDECHAADQACGANCLRDSPTLCLHSSCALDSDCFEREDDPEFMEEQRFLAEFSWKMFCTNPNDRVVAYLIDNVTTKYFSFASFSKNRNPRAVSFLLAHEYLISWREFVQNDADEVVDYLLANVRVLRKKLPGDARSFLFHNRNPRVVPLFLDETLVTEWLFYSNEDAEMRRRFFSWVDETICASPVLFPHMEFFFGPAWMSCIHWRGLSSNPCPEAARVLLATPQSIVVDAAHENANDSVLDYLLHGELLNHRLLLNNANPRVLPLLLEKYDTVKHLHPFSAISMLYVEYAHYPLLK